MAISWGLSGHRLRPGRIWAERIMAERIKVDWVCFFDDRSGHGIATRLHR
jgi:hypothetical protein